MYFVKVVIKICPPLTSPKLPFDGDISLIYLRNLYEWGLESTGETVFSDALKLHGGTPTSLPRSRATK